MFDTRLSENCNEGNFASEEDILEVTETVDYAHERGSASGTPILIDRDTDGKVRKATVHSDDGFYFTVGGTGSKKTRTIVSPTILNNAVAGNSMVISDVKGDLYRLTSKTLKKLGYRVVVLNFNDPKNGDAYNPLLPIYYDYKGDNSARAYKALTNLTDLIFENIKSSDDRFWDTTASSYFSGLVISLFENFDERQATISNVLNLHLQGQTKFRDSNYLISWYKDKQNNVAYKLIESTLNAPPETKACIHSYFTSALNKLCSQSKDVINMLSHSTFKADELVDRKTAIFIIANEESLSVYANLITALIQQWYDILINIADQKNGKLKRKVSFILDEFGNLPALRAFDVTISTARARNISFMIVIQSFAQLELRYGKDVANTIIANCTNWIYLHSPDLQITRHISDCTGVIEDETGRQRNLLSPDQLRHLKKTTEDGLTEVLMLLGRVKPIITYLPDISDYIGIDPIEELDIPRREHVEIEPFDFQLFVRKKVHQQMIENLDQSQAILEREHNEQMQEKKKALNEDQYGYMNMMNKVIDELDVE